MGNKCMNILYTNSPITITIIGTSISESSSIPEKETYLMWGLLARHFVIKCSQYVQDIPLIIYFSPYATAILNNSGHTYFSTALFFYRYPVIPLPIKRRSLVPFTTPTSGVCVQPVGKVTRVLPLSPWVSVIVDRCPSL